MPVFQADGSRAVRLAGDEYEHVVVHKWDHHLPLYRQAEMMAAQEINSDRSTLAGWAGQAAHLLDPIVTRIREEGLKAAKLHTDEHALADAGARKGQNRPSRIWAFVVADRASGATDPALVRYKFCGIHPQTELKTLTGQPQADGYAGYEKLYPFRESWK